ncbi:MAG: branched-chain amino acid ABC transporter permease [Alphaproteobacteria bacterium]|nr:branched-chain amino acid ABC transporter permease [Alphaproteobacteria bacterium]
MLGEIVQASFSALTVGSLYALVAVGVALIFNAANFINFAQGEFVMLGGMIMASLYGDMAWPLVLALPVTILIVVAVGFALMKVSIRPGSSRSVVAVLIVTIGASMFLSGVARQVWDADIHRFPAFSGDQPIAFAGAAIAPQSLWIIGVTVLAVACVTLFFHMTVLGKAMRAASVDPVAAGLMGINVPLMAALSFGLSALLGAVAGIVATPLIMVDYAGGMLLAIKGLSAAMLGGMGSVIGAAIGGLLIAGLESFSAAFVASSLKEVVTFLVIINVLLFLPRGLMGGRDSENAAQDTNLED